MTEKQREKAIQALLEKREADLQRQHAYKVRQKALKWIKKYNLPYRVSVDYLKKYGLNSGIVLINRCYPLPGYPRADLLTITPDDLNRDLETLFTQEPGKLLKYDMKLFRTPKPEVKERIEQHNRQFHTWDLETDTGLESWEHEFAHFIVPYDIDSFTVFDMFGTVDASENALYARKRYFKGIIDRFNSANGAYRASEPPYLPEYADKYTTNTFVLDFETDNLGFEIDETEA